MIFKFRNNNNEIKLPEFKYDELLERFEKQNDLSTLPMLFCLCLSKKDDRKERFINKLTMLFRNFKSNDYLYLFKLLRGCSKIAYSVEWEKVSIDMLLEKTMTHEERISILGLAVFHRNGYLREKAIMELIKYDSSKALPFIIIKVNDLIDNIRNTAKKALISKITIDNFRYILKNIKLINKLNEYEIRNNEGIQTKIEELFKLNSIKNILKDSVLNEESYVQEYCLENIITRSIFNSKEAIELICGVKNLYVRTKMVGLILETLTDGEFMECKDLLLQIKGFKVRTMIIEKLYNIGFYKSVKDIEKEALLEYSAVRELARFYMRKFGGYDFIELYKSYLNDSEYSEGAILGLCEVGKASEINLIKQFLNNGKAAVEKKVLKTIGNLDFNNESEIIVEALKSDRPGIVKIARQILMDNKDLFDDRRVYEMYINSNSELLSLSCAMVLCSLGKWKSISYILEMIGNSNIKISAIGENSLAKWFFAANNNFTSPQKKELERLREMLGLYGYLINKHRRNYLLCMSK